LIISLLKSIIESELFSPFLYFSRYVIYYFSFTWNFLFVYFYIY